MLPVLGLMLIFAELLPAWVPEALLASGLAIIALWAVLWFMSQRSPRSGEAQLTPHERIERLKQEDGLQNDMQQLMAEIQTMTQRLGEDLDAKSERLKHLMTHAQAKIDELNRLHELMSKSASPSAQATENPVQNSGNPLSSSAPQASMERTTFSAASRSMASMNSQNASSPAAPAPSTLPPTRQPPRSATASRLATMNKPVAAAAATSTAKSPAPASSKNPSPLSTSRIAPSAAASPNVSGGNLSSGDLNTPLADSVYRLADQGANSIDIARKLNEQVGKVELILALRQV